MNSVISIYFCLKILNENSSFFFILSFSVEFFPLGLLFLRYNYTAWLNAVYREVNCEYFLNVYFIKHKFVDFCIEKIFG